MKKIVLLIAIMLFAFTAADAQSILKKIGKDAADKTVSRSEKTVDKVVEKAFGALDGLITGKKKKKKDKEKEEENDEENGEEKGEGQAPSQKSSAPTLWDCTNDECGHKNNSGKFCEECGAKRPAGMNTSLSIDGVYATDKIAFVSGSSELKFESLGEIQKIADYMKSSPKARFLVFVRYVNMTAPADKVLSEDRAESVVKALVSLGCDEFNLKAMDANDFPTESVNSDNGIKGLYTYFLLK